MANKFDVYLAPVFFSLFFLISLSESRNPPTTQFKPNTLVLPVGKDSTTSLHVAYISKRSPRAQVPYVININGRFLWENCETSFLSSIKNFPQCRSTQCTRANIRQCRQCSPRTTPRQSCHNNTCAVVTTNPITRRNAIGEIAQDALSIQSGQGSNPGPIVTVPQFLFACSPPTLLQGPLPKYVRGVVGLGRGPISLPAQLTSQFGLSSQFGLCLPSYPQSRGVIFFGNGPYVVQPGIDITTPSTFTPLTFSPAGEYFIQVSSIRINGKPVPFPSSASRGGLSPKTMISTTIPYTTLEHSVYAAVTQFFANQISGVPQVKPPVEPFGLCFDSTKLTSTRVGYGVPNIDLVLHNNNALWTITGANSMVQARPGVACLGFVDGGPNPRANIVIGAHQLEDNLVLFDLARSRLGVSSTLLGRRTNCANFNFSSTP